jgi:hypothetical protein
MMIDAERIVGQDPQKLKKDMCTATTTATRFFFYLQKNCRATIKYCSSAFWLHFK